MGLCELFIIAIGLSMDAFAVSICKGLSVEKIEKKHSILAGLYFGGFQAGMPLIGYWIGSHFESLLENVDHWITFLLLTLIGINMILESRGISEKMDASFSMKSMLLLAIATSIDALTVGITFSFFNVQIIPTVCFIGIITFILSTVGVNMGNVFGAKYKTKAELIGGLVLILMGIKILLEHTGIIG